MLYTFNLYRLQNEFKTIDVGEEKSDGSLTNGLEEYLPVLQHRSTSDVILRNYITGLKLFNNYFDFMENCVIICIVLKK
ncbi:hypothetical protein [Candidatus Clostridium radicumherbarum]|uniref:Integrase SAM-like N-terminal domain-containing protein n=1 Tax=Candidatus Clostridium radicumherbarum TaxID=3381662 RepID=A0ABW8TMQ1_9CLOT